MLIVVEGIHGSGKSTLVEKLVKLFQENNFLTVATSWNSHEIIRPVTSQLRRRELLQDPIAFILMHLSDFAFRHDQIIVPERQKGTIVIADRYVQTLIVRGVIRGLSKDYIRQACRFAIRPDITILLDLPAQESFLRREKIPANAIWQVGMKSGKTDDEIDQEGYLAYLEKERHLYQQLALEENDTFVYNAKTSTEVIANDVFRKCTVASIKR